MQLWKHDLKIQYHKDLGVYRSYGPIKYQPGFGNREFTYINPNTEKMEFVWVDNENQFFKLMKKQFGK